RTRFEIGRIDAAIETPNHFLVDCVRSGPNTFAPAALANSEKRRSRRGGLAFYEWNYRRTEGRCDQSPQRRRECLAVPGTTRRKRNRRHPRFTAVFSHLRIHRHTLVSAH